MIKGSRKLDNAQWDIYDLLEDYKEDNTIWNEEDEKIRILKRIINHELSESEKRVLLIYVDAGSLRAAADVLDVTAPTFRSYLNDIKRKVLTLYDMESGDDCCDNNVGV